MKKKNSKLIFTALSVAALAGGAYYFVKNVLNKDSDDDFDDFEDDFDDFDDFDSDDDTTDSTSDGREYVTINISETSKEEPVEIVEPEEVAEDATADETIELEEELIEDTDDEEIETTITDEADVAESLSDDDIPVEEIILEETTSESEK